VHVPILHTGSAILRMIDRATPRRQGRRGTRLEGHTVRQEPPWLVGWSATAKERVIDLRQDTILFSENKSINAHCMGKMRSK
jgi:hypothetical protein